MSKRRKKHKSHDRQPVAPADAAVAPVAAASEDAVSEGASEQAGAEHVTGAGEEQPSESFSEEAETAATAVVAPAESTAAADPEAPAEPATEQSADEAASNAELAATETEADQPAAAPTAEAEEGSVLPPAQIRAALETLVFASPHPITPREIARVLEGVRKEDWQRELEGLRADYSRDDRGLQVIEVAGGFQITTRPEYNDWVRELLDPRTPTRLSVQALETLAVIAYKQPVTLPEIIELRGVKSGGVVKTLLEKRLIRITGRKEVVGRPILYGTTKQFLLHFGLKDLNELPKIEEFAEVLGEEVDVAGLKRAIESPLPVQVGLSDPDGEQIPLFEGPTPAPAPDSGGEPGSAAEGDATGEEGAVLDDASGQLFEGKSEVEAESAAAPDGAEPSGNPDPS